MAERKRLTLLYLFDEGWAGGIYYIQNVIRALNTLSDQFKPYITVIYKNGSSLEEIVTISYPYINFIKIQYELSFLKKSLNMIIKYIFGKGLFDVILPIQKIDCLYPLNIFINTKNISNACYWIPDLQEYHLPQFFKYYDRKARHLRILLMIRSGYPIVFSSFDVLNDFKKFYSYAQNKVFVIPFLSIIGDNYKKINSIDILKKYKLPETYFVCSNQFWTHKNHIIILKALKILKEKNIDVNIVFTGKEYDYRNPRYFSSLQKYIRKNELEKYVLFLGFIDRDEQVKIIDNSLCIIQPSLFEGWSTIVEDAKALNKYIIVSDIPIHREQIAQNCLFFNPADPSELSEKIIFCIQKNNEETHKDYRINVKQFAMNILNLV